MYFNIFSPYLFHLLFSILDKNISICVSFECFLFIRSFVTGTLASSDISLRWWQFCVPFCWNQQILSGQDEALWYTEWVNCDITSSVHVVRLPLWTHEHKTFDSIPFCVIPVREKTMYSMFIITYIHYQLLS